MSAGTGLLTFLLISIHVVTFALCIYMLIEFGKLDVTNKDSTSYETMYALLISEMILSILVVIGLIAFVIFRGARGGNSKKKSDNIMFDAGAFAEPSSNSKSSSGISYGWPLVAILLSCVALMVMNGAMYFAYGNLDITNKESDAHDALRTFVFLSPIAYFVVLIFIIFLWVLLKRNESCNVKIKAYEDKYGVLKKEKEQAISKVSQKQSELEKQQQELAIRQQVEAERKQEKAEKQRQQAIREKEAELVALKGGVGFVREQRSKYPPSGFFIKQEKQ